eukprot:4417273-Pleurochrysis_carterae.AAC.2
MLCLATPLTVLPELVKSDRDCGAEGQDVEQERQHRAGRDMRRLRARDRVIAVLVGHLVRWFVGTRESRELVADGVEI